jgi:uncharacterized protein (TIGR03382 family)
MKRTLAVMALGMVSTLAHAEPRATYRWLDPSQVGAQWVSPAPSGVSHIIFLNNCQPNGCTLTPGSDGTQNQSDIVNSQVHVSAYSGTTTQWNAIVNCVKQTYSPFNVQIVTTRPAAGTDYHTAIVAGHAADIGESQGVLGVSPFTCNYIPNAMSFSFANEEPTNIDDICWTVSQETAHSWGLDHKYDDRDPMTYLTSGPAIKSFQNQAGRCGEYSPRNCNCTYDSTGMTQENAYAVITATFGSSAPDTQAPTVQITSPTNGSQVMAGFAVHANITDNTGVASAQLKIDGTAVGSPLSSAPWVWNAPSSITMGSHHVEVDATDAAGNVGTAAVDVAFGAGCTSNSQCMGSGEVCLNHVCVAGPSMPGGLGSSCTSNTDCASNECASDGQGHMYCVEPCDPSMKQCPGGFTCQAAGTGGVCWPGADNGGGGGGCAAGGGSSGAPILLGLGLAAMLITRRRR